MAHEQVGNGSGSVDRAGSAPLLEVRDVTFSYDQLQVLFGVSLEVPRGGRVALLGTNGAGKSTLLGVIAGLHRQSAGAVIFDGDDLGSSEPEERALLGMTMVEGGRAMFPSMTVEENVRIGAYPYLDRPDAVGAAVEDVLELFPALRSRWRQPAGTLSGGEQQMVALGRALMAGPQLLIVDELSLGLAPTVIDQITTAIREMVERRGMTLLLVEQSLPVVIDLAEHAYFMEKGLMRFSGPPAELLDRGDLVRAVFLDGASEIPAAQPEQVTP